jgi:hypothetical protein
MESRELKQEYQTSPQARGHEGFAAMVRQTIQFKSRAPGPRALLNCVAVKVKEVVLHNGPAEFCEEAHKEERKRTQRKGDPTPIDQI